MEVYTPRSIGLYWVSYRVLSCPFKFRVEFFFLVNTLFSIGFGARAPIIEGARRTKFPLIVTDHWLARVWAEQRPEKKEK